MNQEIIWNIIFFVLGILAVKVTNYIAYRQSYRRKNENKCQ